MYQNVNLCSFSMADSWMPVNYHSTSMLFLLIFQQQKYPRRENSCLLLQDLEAESSPQ